MAKGLGKIERKNNKGTLKSFFFGTFIGILLGIGAIAGIAAFAYFKVSANWINDKFKTELTLGNEDLNNLTLNKVVNHAIGLVQNMDSYTLNNLKDDFGIDIGDEIIGIDITDLKDVPVLEMEAAVQEKFSNISAYELRNVLDLSGMMTILEQENTYYFNEDDNKLYLESTHDNEVRFAYTYDSVNHMIRVKGQQDTIPYSNEVQFQLQYLPLTIAFEDMASGIGGDVTIGEIGGYGITLPDFLNKPKYEDRKLSELDAIVNEMYVADILDLNYAGAGDVTDGEGNAQTGVIAVIAKLQIKNLASGIDGLTVLDMFGTSSTGVLSLIPATTRLSDIPSAINSVLTSKTIDELITAGVVAAPSNYYGTNGIKDKYISLNVGTAQDPDMIEKKVSDLLLQDIVKISFNLFGSVGGLLLDSDPNS